MSLTTYVYGTVFLILLTTKTFYEQFETYILAKMFLSLEIKTFYEQFETYILAKMFLSLEILTWSPKSSLYSV